MRNLTNLIIFVEQPMEVGVFIKISLLTRSKASWKSKNAAKMSFLLASPSSTYKVKFARLSAHDWPLRKPVWLIESILLCSSYHCSLLLSKTLKSLQKHNVKAIGRTLFPSSFSIK